MQTSDSATIVGLRLDVDKELVDFLASKQIEKREQITDKGFSVAMQKARYEGVECLQLVPEFLDETLVALRNSLVHLPSQGKLDQPISIPGSNRCKRWMISDLIHSSSDICCPL